MSASHTRTKNRNQCNCTLVRSTGITPKCIYLFFHSSKNAKQLAGLLPYVEAQEIKKSIGEVSICDLKSLVSDTHELSWNKYTFQDSAWCKLANGELIVKTESAIENLAFHGRSACNFPLGHENRLRQLNDDQRLFNEEKTRRTTKLFKRNLQFVNFLFTVFCALSLD